MGSREQLILVYSKSGWDQLTNLIGSTFLSSTERKRVVDVINDHDAHQTDACGAHLLYFSECDTSCAEVQLLISSLHSQFSAKEWFTYIIFEDGSEDSFGGFYNNSFCPSVERRLKWDDNNALNAGKVNIGAPAPVVAKPIATTAINNHVCPTCGNTACSRSEKKCWKCGNPL